MAFSWDRIVRLMDTNGWTWQKTATRLGCSTPAMSQWKSGKTSPSRRMLIKIDEAERESGIAPPEKPKVQQLIDTPPLVTREYPADYLPGASAIMAKLDEILLRVAAVEKKLRK